MTHKISYEEQLKSSCTHGHKQITWTVAANHEPVLERRKLMFFYVVNQCCHSANIGVNTVHLRKWTLELTLFI